MRLIDSMCAPGSRLEGGLKTGTGDDRYVFDEAAGWACVIDGATDVGPVRIFSAAESDAARFAELLAAEMVRAPADPREIPQAWFARLLPRLRTAVERDARIRLGEAPRSSYPTAAATWIRVSRGRLEAASLGDSVAILKTPDGAVSVFGEPGKPAEEQERARRIMERTPEERLTWLQEVRTRHNTPGAYWVFGVEPAAGAHIVYQDAPAPPGSRVMVMTDGFYRLVSPYGRYGDEGLIDAAVLNGLAPLLRELRSMETAASEDAAIGRFKTSDDATALLFEI